jgi:hypothetical protein
VAGARLRNWYGTATDHDRHKWDEAVADPVLNAGSDVGRLPGTRSDGGVLMPVMPEAIVAGRLNLWCRSAPGRDHHSLG